MPDAISLEMDLFNIELGLNLVLQKSNTFKNSIIYKIINTIKAGKIKVIKKDIKGNFLTCANKIIS